MVALNSREAISMSRKIHLGKSTIVSFERRESVATFFVLLILSTLQREDFLLTEEQRRRLIGLLHQLVDGLILGSLKALFDANNFTLVPVIKVCWNMDSVYVSFADLKVTIALYFAALVGKILSGVGLLYLGTCRPNQCYSSHL
jgi:hypothetical protein